MDETQLQEYRRKRLADWVKKRGGAKAVCEKRNLPKSVQSYISQIVGGYSIGPRAARTMEQKLGMDARFLDDVENEKISHLSPMAFELAQLFDEVLPPDRQKRSLAYNALSAVIMEMSASPEALGVRKSIADMQQNDRDARDALKAQKHKAS